MTLHPTPAKFATIYPHQKQAIEDVYDAFTRVNVVFLDAPTGSGKTLIGHQVAAALDVPTLYVCTDHALQHQFHTDFPYAKLLKGRANYPTELRQDMTCADCVWTKRKPYCLWCNDKAACPYEVAKDAALKAPLAVLNTAYLLTEANWVGRFGQRPFVVVDEGDNLPGSLRGFVEFRLPRYAAKKYGQDVPEKGTRKTTILKWLEEYVKWNHGLVQSGNLDDNMQVKMDRLYWETETFIKELRRDIDATTEEDEDKGRWLRDYEGDGDALIFKPTLVNAYGNRMVWRHARKWLVMSASIISAEELADTMGLTQPWELVVVPSTFPPENRPIIMAPVADVTRAKMQQAIPLLDRAILKILALHPGERTLIHTVSYDLTKRLSDDLRAADTGRRIITYPTAKGRQEALARFLATPGAVLLAPSMERGIDLPDDACRVQIIAKCPFPSLGDRQVSAQFHLPGGKMWYAVQTIRDLVQMTGRAVRHADDTCVTYILDAQFSRNIWGRYKPLFPQWWRDAVVSDFNIRQLIT